MFEKEGTQRIIMAFASLGFIAILVVPALDHRFGWSAVPVWAVVLGDVLVAIGFFLVFVVYRENTFAASPGYAEYRQRVRYGLLPLIWSFLAAPTDASTAMTNGEPSNGRAFTALGNRRTPSRL